ncbi:MAG: VWA domain-containing protein [Parvibaculum sp.]|uniref:vWA domain-containing protein n=1 Tax=Parvibaculum sp. TaxID=2024848 RepID=UPI0025F251A4|nr:VWA domain-containing protein [Parvibaculum sp.]MCE9650597.1 VWA domain-containing protein [Parvibaculum sp.]
MANVVNSGSKRLGGFCRRWLRDRRGSYAVIFALTLIPVLIAIGAAVDISQAYIVKQRLTRALDAAGLAVGGATGLPAAQIQTMAQNYFNANYPSSKIGVPGTLSVTTSGNVVNLSVSAVMPTSIMGIVGFNTLNISASSQVTRMGKKLEVVLVLDNTGSMASSSKLTTLKTAAKNLITTVSAAAVNVGDVKVAIVPFTTQVNVGTANKNASWLRLSYPKTVTTCTFGIWCTTSTTTITVSKNSWQGCVIDRDQNYDTLSTIPTSDVATQYPADQDCSIAGVMPLSSDWTALNDRIDDMVASGNTNTTIGLQWGWNMLVPGTPLSTAATTATNLDKIIVFLTDGENTENRWSSDGNTIDARTTLICNNIKSTGIKVYSVRVIDGDATLIKSCATDAGMYYSVSNASQLTTVFASIAQALSNLRISQ